MPRLTVGTENSAPIEIHYEDHGSADRAGQGSARLQVVISLANLPLAQALRRLVAVRFSLP